jgi:hypothetical protein
VTRGGGHKDEERTKLRQETGEFECHESYIRRDGAEFLFGCDKVRRYVEIFERDGHRCTACARLLEFRQMHPHHKLERSKGGDDSLENLTTLCGACHIGPSGQHP